MARAELAGIAGRLAKAYPDTNATRGVRVLRLAEEVRLHHDRWPCWLQSYPPGAQLRSIR